MTAVSQLARRDRQRTEILELAALGLRRREIAETLGISERTVQRTTTTAAPLPPVPPERLKTARAKSLWLAMMRDKAKRRDGALARYVEPRIARVVALLPPDPAAGPENGTCRDTEGL